MQNGEEIVQEIEEKVLIKWQAPERVYRLRSREFYGTVSVLAILVAIVLFFIEGVMPVLVVAAILFVVFTSSKVEPREIEYRITNFGVGVAETVYGWGEMVVFWDKHDHGRDVISVITTRRWPMLVALILPKEGVKLGEVKKEMAKRVRFERPKETFGDRMGKWFAEKVPLE